MTGFKMTVRVDCMAAVGSTPPSIKALAPDCQWLGAVGVGGVSLWTRVPPLPHIIASEIKQTLLSTNFTSLLASEQQAAGPHFQLQFHQCLLRAFCLPGHGETVIPETWAVSSRVQSKRST